MNKKDILQQEHELVFESFQHAFGLKFGLELIDYIQSHNLKV